MLAMANASLPLVLGTDSCYHIFCYGQKYIKFWDASAKSYVCKQYSLLPTSLPDIGLVTKLLSRALPCFERRWSRLQLQSLAPPTNSSPAWWIMVRSSCVSIHKKGLGTSREDINRLIFMTGCHGCKFCAWMTILYCILVWCPGQNKRIALFSFLQGCRKRRLKD
jgi:hypothetical protein